MTAPQDPGEQERRPPTPEPGQQPPPNQPAYGYQPAGQPGYPAPPGYGYQPAPPMAPGYGYGQVSAAPPGMYVDQSSGLLLPNGTVLASSGRRIGAYFLAIPLFVVTLGIGYVIWGLVAWGKGQTPALQVLGMRVWRPEQRRPASWGIMALREIVGRIVDGVLSIITLLISFVLMLTGKERKTLHDMVAGTVVLHDPNKVIAA